jgi:hypothetical protein
VGAKRKADAPTMLEPTESEAAAKRKRKAGAGFGDFSAW